ncbi:hypothetical protein Tco_0139166, partial [Tanacetum coccineum]
LFSEEVAVLKREVGCKNYEINVLKSKLKKVKQEKDGIDFKIKKFDKASKDLDQLLGSQITDNSKKGFGYSAVPPPHPLIYNRPNKLDLSYSGLDEFKEPEFKGYGPENSKKESNVVCENESDNSKKNSDKYLVEEQVLQVKSSYVEGCGSNTNKSVSEVEPKKVWKNNDAPIIEDWVSDDEEQDESKTKPEKKTVIPTTAIIEKPVKKPVRPRIVNTARSYRTPANTVRPREVNTARSNRTSVNAARANRFNAVKPSACWVWRPIKSNRQPQHDDKDLLTVDVKAMIGTVSNNSACTSEENCQECIVMPIWKDSSYFDSPSENVDNGEPKTADDAQKQDKDGLNNENAKQESPDVNTGSPELNVVDPSVSTASPNEEDNTDENREVDLGTLLIPYCPTL